MLLIYNLSIRLYQILIVIASFFNDKAKKWLSGRKDHNFKSFSESIWFHFASLGEFEQGRPVLEKMRALHPSKKVVVTFFSPSGYEIRKNTPLADAVYYLPLDTAANAQQFIRAINPGIAVFTKYEYWYHYFNTLHQQQIPLYIISGIFKPDQVFFKWYGGLHRKMLGMVTWFFVQDDASKRLLENLKISHVSVSGDTRFDRVWDNAENPKSLPVIARFKNDQPVFIAGSTWPDDEKLLAQLVSQHPDWKFIFAPHEIPESKIEALLTLLPAKQTIRFSQLSTDGNEVSDYRILIIDNIGMLSSLYQYGEIAFIGGGFGAGIHNTLEAAAFGLPVIFGPKYQKFKEACDLVDLQGGFSIETQEQLSAITEKLITDNNYRVAAREVAKTYVSEHIGATEMILKKIS